MNSNQLTSSFTCLGMSLFFLHVWSEFLWLQNSRSVMVSLSKLSSSPFSSCLQLFSEETRYDFFSCQQSFFLTCVSFRVFFIFHFLWFEHIFLTVMLYFCSFSAFILLGVNFLSSLVLFLRNSQSLFVQYQSLIYMYWCFCLHVCLCT